MTRRTSMSFRKWFYRNVYLHTPYWHWLRVKVGERSNFKCEVDGCRVVGHNLNAHHTTYNHLWFEWLFLWQMVWLCPPHHSMTHGGATLKYRHGRTLKPFHY